jgi:hypothetical protein
MLCVNSKKKQSEFLCEIEYRNIIPDPPIAEPKLRLLQLPLQRLLVYSPMVDREFQQDLLAERDLVFLLPSSILLYSIAIVPLSCGVHLPLACCNAIGYPN